MWWNCSTGPFRRPLAVTQFSWQFPRQGQIARKLRRNYVGLNIRATARVTHDRGASRCDSMASRFLGRR